MTGARNEGRWCILRCSGASTLALAASLNEAGYEAWAPVTREIKHVGENRTRQEVAVPLMPGGYVFARSENLAELLALSHSPSMQFRVWDSELRRMVTKGYPHFRVFQAPAGLRDFATDRELDVLRSLERKPRAARVERTFSVGDKVRTDDGGFAGLTGTVIEVRKKTVIVAFGTWGTTPEFPNWALRPLDEPAKVHVNAELPERDAA
jgi:transcription antitermination factor NusG